MPGEIEAFWGKMEVHIRIRRQNTCLLQIIISEWNPSLILIFSIPLTANGGKSIPAALPYVHDTSGDGAGQRQQQAGTIREEPTQSVQPQSEAPADPDSHEAALQRNALHR